MLDKVSITMKAKAPPGLKEIVKEAVRRRLEAAKVKMGVPAG